MIKKTLEEIIKFESEHRNTSAMFGVDACKEAIKSSMEWEHKSLYQLLEGYMERANNEVLFNPTMVFACWELINGK